MCIEEKQALFLNILKNFENLIKRKFVPFFFIVELPELIIAVVASAIIIIELILTAKFIGLICIVYVAIHMVICVQVLGKQEDAEKKMTKSANHYKSTLRQMYLQIPYEKQAFDSIIQYLKLENIDENLDKGKLSGGEKKKINLARFMYEVETQNREVVVLDEPTNHIDIQTKEKLLAYLKQMTDRIVIVISHDNDVISCADEVIAFQNMTKQEKCWKIAKKLLEIT